MAEIAELEQRVLAALSRIRDGADRLAEIATASEGRLALGQDAAPEDLQNDLQTDGAATASWPAAAGPLAGADAPSAAQAERIAHLEAALDAERQARAAADAALAALHAAPQPDAKAEIDRLTRQLDAQGLDTQRLRASVAQLREELRRLREAAEAGLDPDAGLINRALQAELEALRAVRASETTEIADILAILGPLVDLEEVRHLA